MGMVFVKKRVQGEVLKDILCDVCGKSCSKFAGTFDFATLNASWGYGSHKDGEAWICIMCESCADKIRDYIISLGGTVKTEYAGVV